MKNFILIFFCLSFAISAMAQTVVTGNVVDTKGEAVIGATVLEESTTNGTVTDIDGNFSLTVSSPNATLNISNFGYQTQSVSMNGKTTIKVTLSDDVQMLQDVVAIGYGTQTKKELTGAIASIKPEDFNKGTQSNPLGLVQGKVAGLTIIKNGGDDPAQNSYQVQIRGLGTLGGGTAEPLYIVDGIPKGDLTTVPLEDVESIDVLKDGSAAAIYGTRANNGVILITTKRGNSDNKVSLDYSGDFGIGFIAKVPRVLNAEEYRKYMVNEGRGIDYGGSTNWMKELVRPSTTTTHSLSIAGGVKNFNYRATVGFKNATGLAISSDFSQINAKLAADQKAFNNHLNIQYDLSYTTNKKNWVDYSVFDRALQANPTIPLRFDKSDPDYEKYDGWYEINDFGTYNPVARIKESQNLQKNYVLLGSIKATLTIANHIKIGTSYSLQDVNSWNGKYYSRYRKGDYILGKGKAEQNYDFSRMQTIESTIQYFNNWNKHSFQAIVGHYYSIEEYQGFYAMNTDFPVDFIAYNNLEWGKGLQTGVTQSANMSSYRQIDKIAAFFGRAIYNYAEKYFLNLSLRIEGSSRFGPKADPVLGRFGLFPAVSASWRISEEKFLKDNKKVDELKLRAGYGVTGNIPGDRNRYIMKVGPGSTEIWLGDGWVTPWGPLSNENLYLRWEKKHEFNLGLDFSFVKRVSGTIDAYLRNIVDLLWEYNVPSPPYPYGKKWDNYGQLRNMGIEISLNYQAIKSKDLNWNIGLVLAKNVNKVIKITGGEYADNNSGYLNVGYISDGIRGVTGLNVMRLEEGKAVGNFYGYKFADIREDGTMRYYTLAGGITSAPTSADLQVIGNALPWATFGLNTTLTYKNWEFSLNFRGQFGGKIFNERRFGLEWVPGSENVLLSAVDPNAAIAPNRQASLIKNNQERYFSDFYLEDASYLKLSDVSIGYSFKLPENVKRYMHNVRLGLTGQNLFTITKYSGVDPEVSMSGLEPGYDRIAYYPRQRNILFYVKASF